MPPLDEYDALVEKAEAFLGAARGQAGDQLSCQRGCSDCCRVQLSLCAVEAAAVRRFLDALPGPQLAALKQRAGLPGSACCMLSEDGSCAIYHARPLVCRTQGLALRYPHGLIPVETVRGRDGEADVTWCPLNYRTRAPTAGEVLDAERLDQLLALVNQRHCAASDGDSLSREGLPGLVSGHESVR